MKQLVLLRHGGISDEAIVDVNIPTGVPLVYALTDGPAPIRGDYLDTTT